MTMKPATPTTPATAATPDDFSPFGVPLSALSADATSLSLAEFSQRHAPAFFIRLGANSATPRVPMRTISRPSEANATGETIMVALPIRKRPTSDLAFVSIGRLDGNDIAIADESVSKFHAFVKEVGGGYAIQDARSKNGTLVDGVKIARRGEGPPTPLVPGNAVRFGIVHASFVDAAGVVELIKRMSRG